MTRAPKRHTNSEYEAELGQVRENLLLMAGCVEEMIGDAVRSLMDGDVALAEQTIEADHKVNRFEIETDELCLLILAKRQPVASDLRFITLAMKMVTDLERIGDMAVNICERTLALSALTPEPVTELVPRMGDAARGLVRDAIDSFIERDADKAQKVWDEDAEVDDLYQQICDLAQARMSDDPTRIERGVHVQAVAKFLERIGDHATNLAEMVVFMIKGQDVRHAGKL